VREHIPVISSMLCAMHFYTDMCKRGTYIGCNKLSYVARSVKSIEINLETETGFMWRGKKMRLATNWVVLGGSCKWAEKFFFYNFLLPILVENHYMIAVNINHIDWLNQKSLGLMCEFI